MSISARGLEGGKAASPSSSFEVAESHLLLELLVVALDAPAQLGEID
jgi:hypothetical protein